MFNAKLFNQNEMINFVFLVAILIIWSLAFMPVPLGFSLSFNTYFSFAMSENLGLNGIVPPLVGYFLYPIIWLFGRNEFSVHIASGILMSVELYAIKLLIEEIATIKKALIFLYASCVGFVVILTSSIDYSKISEIIALFCILFFIRLFKYERAKYFLYLGMCLGLGLLNKWDILWINIVFFILILALPPRKLILSKSFVFGLIFAIVIALPYLISLYQYNILSLYYYFNYHFNFNLIDISSKIYDVFKLVSLWLVPLWIIGFFTFLINSKYKKLKSLTYAFLILLLTVLFMEKLELILLPFIFVFLIGGVCLLVDVCHNRLLKGILVFYVLVSVFLNAIQVLLYEIPYLYSYTSKSLMHKLGIKHYSKNLQQHIGGRKLTAYIAEIYDDLPQHEQAKTGIWASNYMIASPIFYYRAFYDLPNPISPHQNWYQWLDKNESQKTQFIYIGPELMTSTYPSYHQINIHNVFEQVKYVGKIHVNHAPDYVSQPVWLVQGFKNNHSLRDNWLSFQNLSSQK